MMKTSGDAAAAELHDAPWWHELLGIGATMLPVGHRHINFRGFYRFPVERYAARLLVSAAQSTARAPQQRNR
jgi:hypothetical protein